MSEIGNKQEFTNAEYVNKIIEAEKELERVRIASIEYLDTLAKTEQALNKRKQAIVLENAKVLSCKQQKSKK